MGLALVEWEAQRVIETGEIPFANHPRGVDHAWNINDKGEVVDSTWRNASECRYYGVVVPTVTAASFKDDKDVSDYTEQLNHSFDLKRRDMRHKTKLQVFAPPFTKLHDMIASEGYKYIRTDSNGPKEIIYVFIKGGAVLSIYADNKGTPTSVSLRPKDTKTGQARRRSWDTFESWLAGEDWND